MCQSSPILPCFQRPAISHGVPLVARSVEPSLQGSYTPLPTIDWSREASKALYPTRTGPSVEDKILNILNNGYEPPITLGSKLTLSDMDALNTPVCLGSTVTFKSLGFGKNT